MSASPCSFAQHIFHPFCQKSGQCKVSHCADIFKKIGFVVLSILIFMATLGIAHTVYYCTEPKNLVQLGNNAYSKIKSVTVQFVEDPDAELARLKNALSQKVWNLMEDQYNHIAIKPSVDAIGDDQTREKLSKVVLGRALEIKEEMKDDYYIFTHAQTTFLLPITYLLDAIVKTAKGDKPKGFHYLRSPFASSTIDKNDLDQVLDYQKREDLLSVDAYFYNWEEGESNGYYLVNNKNAFTGEDAVKAIVKKIVESINPEFDFTSQAYIDLVDTLMIYCNELKSETVGLIYLICIPKAVIDANSDGIGYVSHPFGRKCDCIQENEHLKTLQEMQKDIHQNCNAQYRLFAKELKPDQGTKIHIVSHLPKSQKKQVKEAVGEIGTQLYQLVKQ